MPAAHFLVFSPFLSSICPCLVQADFISAPCFTPAATTVCILTCHYNYFHLSVLTSPCPVSISSTLTHAEPQLSRAAFVQFTFNSGHKRRFFWKMVRAEKPQQLPLFFSVFVFVSELFVLWQDYLIVCRFSACMLSFSRLCCVFTDNTGLEGIAMSVCSFASGRVTSVNRRNVYNIPYGSFCFA